MRGLHDLLGSERGVWSIGTLGLSLVLVFTGHLKAGEWLDFVKYLSTVLLTSKTISSATRTLRGQPPIPQAIVVENDKAPEP